MELLRNNRDQRSDEAATLIRPPRVIVGEARNATRGQNPVAGAPARLMSLRGFPGAWRGWRFSRVHQQNDILALDDHVNSLAGRFADKHHALFLGRGVQGLPSWGGMLDHGADVFLLAPHLAIAPGLAILLSVVALNFVGDGLRDWLDPRTATASGQPGL